VTSSGHNGDVDAVEQAMIGQKTPNLTGGIAGDETKTIT